MYIGLHVKYPLFLSDINEMNFHHRSSKTTQISNLMTIRHVRAQLSHGQRDMTKLIVAFRNFTNAPKSELTWSWLGTVTHDKTVPLETAGQGETPYIPLTPGTTVLVPVGHAASGTHHTRVRRKLT